jgi:dihydrofolate reductase
MTGYWPWNAQGGPFKDSLNNTHKYVASNDPLASLAWPNSSLLRGDVVTAVTELKRTQEANLVILGSGVLIRSLIAADAIDEYLVMIAPLVLGTGRRLFADGVAAALQLVEVTPTRTGAIVVSYAPAR